MIKRSKLIRAGSPSSKLDHVDAKGDSVGRINGHFSESKKSQDKIYVYNYYPDKDSTNYNTYLKRGEFQDLEFVSYIRFKE